MIRLRNVAKNFYFPPVHQAPFSDRKSIRALANVTFQVKPGSCLGIIGANGSGKTTLLKIISGILQPTAGQVLVEGTIAPLLELGVGFHPDLTARENIQFYGLLLGMKGRMKEEEIRQVLAFAELKNVADLPLRVLSAGMQARLAFATAVYADPEILLVDEVLAVGDLRFQEKCLKVFERWKQEGKTIVVVSHDMALISHFADQVVLLHKGKIVGKGKPYPTIRKFMRILNTGNSQQGRFGVRELSMIVQERDAYIAWLKGLVALKRERWGSKEIEITKVELLDKHGKQKNVFKTGEVMKVLISYRMRVPVKDPVFGIVLRSGKRVHCFGTNTAIQKIRLQLKKRGQMLLTLHDLPIREGEYYVSVNVHDKNDHHYDWHDNYYRFRVENATKDAGLVQFRCSWRHV